MFPSCLQSRPSFVAFRRHIFEHYKTFCPNMNPCLETHAQRERERERSTEEMRLLPFCPRTVPHLPSIHLWHAPPACYSRKQVNYIFNHSKRTIPQHISFGNKVSHNRAAFNLSLNIVQLKIWLCNHTFKLWEMAQNKNPSLIIQLVAMQ